MTDEAIKDGFAALKDNDDYESLYQAARCRSEADWLVGMISPAFSLSNMAPSSLLAVYRHRP